MLDEQVNINIIATYNKSMSIGYNSDDKAMVKITNTFFQCIKFACEGVGSEI